GRLLGRRAPVVGERHLDTAIDEMASADRLTQHDATFERRDVVRAWCATLPGGAAVDLDVIEALTNMALEDEQLVQLHPGDPASAAQRVIWSTRDMLQTEERLLAASVARRADRVGIVDAQLVDPYLDRRSDLSD